MKKYKNISQKSLVLIGIGLVKPDEVITTNKDINNPNFIEIDDKVEIKKEGKLKDKK